MNKIQTRMDEIKTFFMKRKLTFLTFLLMLSFCLGIQHIQAQKNFINPLPIPYTIEGPDWRLDIIDTVHNFDPNGAIDMVINQNNGDTAFYNLNVSVQAFAYNNPDSTRWIDLHSDIVLLSHLSFISLFSNILKSMGDGVVLDIVG